MRKNLSSTLFRTALTVAMSAALAVILPAELFGQNGGVLAANEWTCDQNCLDNEHSHNVTVRAGQVISGGTFNWTVTVENDGTITGGTFNSGITVKSGGEISNVTGMSQSGLIKVETGGKITGGTFNKSVQLEGGTIEGGTFNSETYVNSGTIQNGTFNNFRYNGGTINGGNFSRLTGGDIENKGTINGGTFNNKVKNQSGASIYNGNFYGTVNNSGTIIGGCYVEGGIVNNDGGSVGSGVTYNLTSPSGGTGNPTGGETGNTTEGATDSAKSGSKAIPHTHSYSWVTVQDASVGQDGLEEYRCSCGDVQERCVIPASAVAVKGLYGAVKDAPQNGTASFDSGRLYTISDYVIKKLAERTDVTTVITFEYQNQAYKMTIPAGVDYAPLLSDGDYFYGYFYFAKAVGATIEAVGM